MLFSPQIPLQLDPRRPDRFEDFVAGPNAQAVEDKVDLRLLHRRHRNLAQRVFRETVMHGRPGTEMPEWRETLSGHEEWIDLLQSFIFSIQTE